MGNKKKLAAKKRRNQIIILILQIIFILCLICVSYVASLMDLMQRDNSDYSFYHRDRTSEEVIETTKEEQTESESDNTEDATSAEETEESVTKEIDTKTTYTTFLLVGVDARAGDGLISNTHSDTVIVCVINDQTKQVRLASIYRDTYLRWADGTYGKLTDQLFDKDIYHLVDSINYDLDLDIDRYVVVNWAVAANIVNALGGIDMELTDKEVGYGVPNADINGYINTIVENTGIPSTGIFEGGMLHLDGVQAVAYCRIRYVGNDFERTHRQRKVITAVLEKAKEEIVDKKSISPIIKIAEDAFPNIGTNFGYAELLMLAADVMNYEIESQYGFPSNEGIYSSATVIGRIPEKDCIVTRDFCDEVKKLHEFLYDDTDYVVPQDIVEINEYIRNIAEIND
ncbi:MAG: LCP family protein [Lachnospiraceae bacterium]